jgi:hypothetical protein
MAFRLMQHGLAVETDHGHVTGGQAVCREVGFNRLGVDRGQERLRLRQRPRPRLAVAQVAGGGDRAAQYRALRIAIGAVTGRPEPADGFTVGIDERDVDPVIGGAAHQTDGRKVAHRRLPIAGRFR